MEKVKLCKDCAMFFPDPNWPEENYKGTEFEGNSIRFGRCSRTADMSLVSGTRGFERMRFCSGERVYNWLDCRITGQCGKEGRYWEPKG